MITKILFGLIAVVVLIVIIGGAALHFLRADDSDSFDEIPDEPRQNRRSPSADPRDHPAEPQSAQRGRPRSAKQGGGQQRAAAGRASRPPAERSSNGYREPDNLAPSLSAERRGPAGSQPNGSRPPARQAASPRQTPPRAAAGPSGPARGARPAAVTDSSSWDALSDVDYWAELAADKPFNAADTGPSRRGSEQPPAARAPAGGRRAAAPAPDPAQLPVRSRQSRPAPAGQADGAPTQQLNTQRPPAARYPGPVEPATESIAALARLGGQQAAPGPRPAQRPAAGQRPAPGQRPTAGQRQRPPAARPGSAQRTGPQQVPAAPPVPAAGHGRLPLPMDDDPLTSPSFPAINTSDSRSYRPRSSGHTQPGLPVSNPGSGGSAGNGSGGNGSRGNGQRGGTFGEPAHQVPQYPAAADRSASMPNGYPVQQVAAQVPPLPMPSQPPVPVANPYGSYVNAAQPAADNPGYGGYNPGQQASGGSAYGTPADGYLPAPSNGNGAGHGHGRNGTGTGAGYDYDNLSYDGAGYDGAGYDGAGYNNASYESPRYDGVIYNGNGYAAEYEQALYQAPVYQAGQPVPPGYGQQNGQYDPRGYGTPDLAYGQEGYQGYPGYGGAGR